MSNNNPVNVHSITIALLTPLVVGLAGYGIHHVVKPINTWMINDAIKRNVIPAPKTTHPTTVHVIATPFAQDFSGNGRTPTYLQP
jgi:hypothetical protein